MKHYTLVAEAAFTLAIARLAIIVIGAVARGTFTPVARFG
jgi:hypothetical protein